MNTDYMDIKELREALNLTHYDIEDDLGLPNGILEN